jgi:SAM-dependent methyltransferase
VLLYNHLSDIAKQDGRILDVGCKVGRHLTAIESDVVALDIEIKPNHPQLMYVVGDGCQLPFRDNAFDFVLSSQVLEHIPTDMKKCFCTEIARVLKSGGQAFISFPNRFWPGNPHFLPAFFPLLPRDLALIISKVALSWEQHRYYRNEVFHLSPIKARQLLSSQFETVEYVTLDALEETNELSPPWQSIRRLKQIVNPLFSVPGIEPLVELMFPYAMYKCSNI